tara:strand:+ start:18487 stop:19785 length:1299 start_codon:yes stop_codon:yes gene_type:complete
MSVLDTFLNWFDAPKYGPRDDVNTDFVKSAKKTNEKAFQNDATDKQGTFCGIVLRVEASTSGEGEYEPGSMPLKKYRAKTGTPPKLVAIKVRIPELHTMLPVPSIPSGGPATDCTGKRNRNILKRCHHPIIDLYPTFYAINPGVPTPAPGDIVRVKYGDLNNFKDPVYLSPETGNLRMAIGDGTSVSAYGAVKTVSGNWKNFQGAVLPEGFTGWNRTYQRATSDVVWLVMHETGGPMHAGKSINYVNNSKSGFLHHYVGWDGKLWNLASYDQWGVHAGSLYNPRSVGFEVVNPFQARALQGWHRKTYQSVEKVPVRIYNFSHWISRTYPVPPLASYESAWTIVRQVTGQTSTPMRWVGLNGTDYTIKGDWSRSNPPPPGLLAHSHISPSRRADGTTQMTYTYFRSRGLPPRAAYEKMIERCQRVSNGIVDWS